MKTRSIIQVLLPYAFLPAFLIAGLASAFAPGSGGPGNGGTGVPVQAMVDRAFDLALSGATVGTGTVSLKINVPNTQVGTPTGSNLCTRVMLRDGDRVFCEHTANLAVNQWHTFTITTGVKTATGMALASNAVYSFQTGEFSGEGYNPPPVVEGSSPRPGGTIPVNAPIRVYFNPQGNAADTTMRTSGNGSVLDPENVKLYAAAQGQPSGANMLVCPNVGGNPAAPSDCNMAWDSTNNMLTITPGKKAPLGIADSTGGSAMTGGASYILVIEGPDFGQFNGGNGVRSTADMTLMGGDYRVEFRTTAADTAGPDTQGSSPQGNSTGVDCAVYDLSAGFTEAVNPATVTGGSVRLYCEDNDGSASNGCSAGTDGWDTSDALISGVFLEYEPEERTVFLSPSSLLAASKKHYMRITSDVKDLAGNRFDGDSGTAGNQAEVISFTTGTNINGAGTDSTKPTVLFSNADNFSVAVTLSEPMKFDPNKFTSQSTSTGANDANNISNWSVQSPPGTAIDISDKRIRYYPSDLTVVISGLTVPPNQQVRVRAVTSTGAAYAQDLSGNAIDTTGSVHIADATVQSMEVSGGMLGPGARFGESDFYSFGMEPIMVYPRTAMAGAASNYEVEFNLNQSIPLGGTIVLTFPQGFSFVADGGSSECRDVLSSIENSDINGPSPGTLTMDSISCASAPRTVTITTAGASTGPRDRLRFLVQGIVNSPVPKDFETSGYAVDIKTRNAGGTILESLTSMPFFLSTPGSQHIHGVVYNDSGAGGGTANNKIKDGTEPGVASVQVCLGGMVGFSCQNTTSTGAFFFNQLSNGFYHIDIPPLSSGNFVGGPFFRDLELRNGDSADDIIFALRSSAVNINVTVNSIPANADLDVFGFNPTNFDAGGHIVRALTWNGSNTRTVSLPVSAGTWEVGVGPWMPKDRGLGPMQMPTFTFMPPRPQQVTVSDSNAAVAFNIQAANRTVSGTVVDGNGTAISNAFVMARPARMTEDIGGGGGAQTNASGKFNLNLTDGVYLIESSMPGMPPSNSAEVTVTADSSNYAVDKNSTADVYSKGVLIINDGDGDSDDLVLKIAKGGLSVAGRVLDESGNPISYAHVMVEQVDASGNPLGRFADSPTDSTGNYTLYVVSGIWEVRGFAPGYGELPILTVTVAGENLTGQNLQVSTSEFGTVTGSVLKGGTAQAGAFVGIWGSSGGNGSVTDGDGNYTLKVRAGSNYTIDGFLPGVGKLTPIENVTVTANQTLGNQNLSIGSPGTILVSISGVTEAFVQALDSSGRGNQTSANTTPGSYSLDVSAGTYTVKAHSPAYGLIGSQSNVSVTAGNTTAVAFSPPAVYSVSGSVVSSSSACKNGATVFLLDTSNGRMIDAQTTSTGGYAVSVPNGTYRLSAGKPGCIDSAAPSSITVNGAAIEPAQRTLNAATAVIAGRVTLNSTGVTIPTMVVAQDANGNFSFDEVDTSESGGGNNYSLSLTPGIWTVSARSDGYTASSRSVTAVSGSTVSADYSLSAITGYSMKERKTSTLTPQRGGFVKDENIGNGFEINFPAGALGSSSDSASVVTKETTAIASSTATTNIVGGKGYEITPKDANGNKITTLSSSDGAGVTVTIPYTESEVTANNYEEAGLVLMVWSEEKQDWDPLSTTVDTVNNTLTANITHFSTFGAGGTTTRSTSRSSSSPSASPSASNSGGSGGGGKGGGYTIMGTSVSSVRESAGLMTEEQQHAAAVQEEAKLKITIRGQEILFKDVPAAAWFAVPVAKILAAGIASGYKDAQGNLKGEYGPANNVTYAEIAKMALESAGHSASEDLRGAPPENPSAKGHWSAGYIKIAEDLGLSVFKGRVNVNYPAKRGAVIQTMLEAAGILIQPRSELEKVLNPDTGEKTVKPIGRYKDLTDSHPHADAIHTASQLGIITGDTDQSGAPVGTVRPNDPINRAEVAKIFAEMMERGYVE